MPTVARWGGSSSPTHGAVVSIRCRGRPRSAVIADNVEGVDRRGDSSRRACTDSAPNCGIAIETLPLPDWADSLLTAAWIYGAVGTFGA